MAGQITPPLQKQLPNTSYKVKKDNNFVFDQRTTNILKGIAVILMFAHHFFGYPEWIAAPNQYTGLPFIGTPWSYSIGKYGSICVSIFAFITGYGVYFSYKKGNVFTNSLEKIAVLYIKYWMLLFLFFIPVEFLLGQHEFSELGLEMLGMQTNIICFAWYVRFYLLAMFTLPLLHHLIPKNPAAGILISILPFHILCVLVRIWIKTVTVSSFVIALEEYFRYIPMTLLGYCFAQSNLFVKLDDWLRKVHGNHIWVYLTVLLLSFFIRNHIPYLLYLPTVDIFFICFIVYIFVKFINALHTPFWQKLLYTLGKHSLYLWFLQSIFFVAGKKLQFLAYFPKLDLLILIVGFAILLPVSIFYTFLYDKTIGRLMNIQ